MIEYRKGDLLDVTSGVIVHGCNMQGVMGSGVAKAVREKYPDCYARYKLSLETTLEQKPKLGDIIWYYHNPTNTDSRAGFWIANALTQENYGRDPNKRYVNYIAIANVFKIIHNSNINQNWTPPHSDVHFPKIGAGLANGDWNIIEQIINDSDPHDNYKKICWTLD